MNCLKKIFSKKEEQKAKYEEDKTIPERIQFLESIAKTNQIEGYKQFVENYDYFIAKLKKQMRAEKIVNEFGQAMIDAVELNKKKVEEFSKDSLSLKELQDKICRLTSHYDIHLLPYDKNTIKEAIELLIQDETDVNMINALGLGLLFLDKCIDFSRFDS